MHATLKKANFAYHTPGMYVVLHSFLSILPPTITIIQNIIFTSRLKRKPGSCCLPQSTPFHCLFITLFSHQSTRGGRRRRRRRSAFHHRIGIRKEVALAREKANPVYVIMQALRFQIWVLHHWHGSEKEGRRVLWILAFHWMIGWEWNGGWTKNEIVLGWKFIKEKDSGR